MKNFQDEIVKGLPKLIIFGIAFYNFVWIIWQNLNHFSACVICPWYITDSFPNEAFLLLIAAYLLFVPRIWSYAISVFTSGYFAVSWMLLPINWFWTTDYSLTKRMEIITSSYFDNPLQIWESQIVIAVTIFGFAVYCLINEKRTKKLD